MQHLSKSDIDAVRKKLELDKVRYAKRIAELSVQDPFSDPDRVNDNAASDQEASEESNHDRVDAVIGQLRQQMQAVDSALARIADHKYGSCESCGQTIAPERLRVLPTALLCLACEQKGA